MVGALAARGRGAFLFGPLSSHAFAWAPSCLRSPLFPRLRVGPFSPLRRERIGDGGCACGEGPRGLSLRSPLFPRLRVGPFLSSVPSLPTPSRGPLLPAPQGEDRRWWVRLRRGAAGPFSSVPSLPTPSRGPLLVFGPLSSHAFAWAP